MVVEDAHSRFDALVEEKGGYLAEMGTDAVLAPLQSAACTYRIALDRRTGTKSTDVENCAHTTPGTLIPGVPYQRPTSFVSMACSRPTRSFALRLFSAERKKVIHPARMMLCLSFSASVRISWARWLKRVFDIDIESLPALQGSPENHRSLRAPAQIFDPF